MKEIASLISPTFSGRKILLHGLEGYEDSQILGVVIAMTNALQRSNHLKTNAIKQNKTIRETDAPEKDAAGFVPQYDYSPFLGVIELD